VVYTGHKRRATCILAPTSEFMLSKQGPAVTLSANGFNIQTFYVLPTDSRCFFKDMRTQQRLYPSTALTYWFL